MPANKKNKNQRYIKCSVELTTADTAHLQRVVDLEIQKRKITKKDGKPTGRPIGSVEIIPADEMRDKAMIALAKVSREIARQLEEINSQRQMPTFANYDPSNKTKHLFRNVRYAEIHSDEWRRLLGGDYSAILNELVRLKLIKRLVNPNNGKETFCNGIGAASEDQETFAKHYTVSDLSYAQIKAKRFVPATVQKFPNPLCRLENAEPKQPPKVPEKFAILQRFLAELQIDKRKVVSDPEFDPLCSRTVGYIHGIVIKAHWISDGRNTPEEKKNGRIFHILICMMKALRKYISHVSGKLIVLIDATAGGPTQLGSFIKDEEERKRWVTMSKSGVFYTALVGLLTPTQAEKEMYKDRFMKAMAARQDFKCKYIQRIRDSIQRDFPHLWKALQEIWESGKTVSYVLGRLETAIFRDPFMKQEKCWWSPAHDGVACLYEDAIGFRDEIQRKAKAILGYEMHLKLTDLAELRLEWPEPSEAVHLSSSETKTNMPEPILEPPTQAAIEAPTPLAVTGKQKAAVQLHDLRIKQDNIRKLLERPDFEKQRYKIHDVLGRLAKEERKLADDVHWEEFNELLASGSFPHSLPALAS